MMNKGDYGKTWRVKNVTIEHDHMYLLPNVSVEVEGNGIPLCSALKLNDIAKSLEDRLNSIAPCFPEIKKVIFNPPVTIILWMDNSKTVVKTQNGEEFDPEKGMTMAICKKLFGNKGNYFNEIKKWTEPYYEQEKKLSLIKKDTIEFEMTSFDFDALKGIMNPNFNGELTVKFGKSDD